MTPDHQPTRGTAKTANGLKGKTIGDFEILEEIGRGGMGVVFKARQVSLDRFVAFKILSQTLGLTDQAVARFRREAQATAKLHHPNIVPIYAQGQQDETYYYAMELVGGRSLYDMIKELRGDGEPDGDIRKAKSYGIGGSSVATDFALAETELLPGGSGLGKSTITNTPSAPTRSGSWRSSGGGVEDPRFAKYDEGYFDMIARQIRDVADALDYAHRQGVIHRDIKPHNLLEGHGGRLCLTDFGLARMLEQPGMTQTGEFVGSPLYMSPEQITGRGGPVGVAADIYSLGATLYEWLTLSPPFPGATREQVISQVITSDSLPPRSRNRRVPVDLETICTKALEKDQSRRYKSAAEMRDDLTRFLNRSKIKAQRAGVFATMGKLLARRRTAAVIALSTVIVAVLSVMLVQERHASRERDNTVRVDTTPTQPTPPTLATPAPEVATSESDSIETKVQFGEQMAKMVGGASALSALFSTGDSEGYKPSTAAERISALFVFEFKDAAAEKLAAFDAGRVDPDSVEFLYLSVLKGEPANQAVADLGKCLELKPDYREARLLRAWVNCLLEQPTEMLADAETLLAADPADTDAIMVRGAANLMLGQFPQALEDFKAAAGKDRDYRIRTLTGLALAKTGQTDSAIAEFSNALLQNDKNVLALLRRAELNMDAGEADIAVLDLSKIVQIEPRNAEAYELRATCNERLKNYQQAVADYKMAYDISGATRLLAKWYTAALNLDEMERVASESQGESNQGGEAPEEVRKQDKVPAPQPPTGAGSVYNWMNHWINGVRIPVAFPRVSLPQVDEAYRAASR
ncbi:MAG: protein kinase [Phycisphaerales bacterium]|nr:protein kinase [Phycisphaerales bacterium]